jgi:hypothetical protein
MLIVPASNVSVPLDVVMRTESNGPVSNVLPPPLNEPIKSVKVPFIDAIHKFPDNFDKIHNPLLIFAEFCPAIWNPVVDKFPDIAVGVIAIPEPKYVEGIAPKVALISTGLDPFVETPFIITVIRFAQLGIPVKSTAVPDAVCAVARVSEPP